LEKDKNLKKRLELGKKIILKFEKEILYKNFYNLKDFFLTPLMK